MKKSHLYFLSLAMTTCLLSLLSFSCTSEDYETGDGKYSYLRSDFVEAHSSAAKTLDYALTDEGDSLIFNPLATVDWATTPDSIYRALLMYNKKDASGNISDVISVGQVLTLSMVPTARMQTVHTDPLTVESMWMSKNGKYLNMGIYVKSGKEEGSDARQSVAVLCDTVMKRDDGTKEYCLRLYHDQNGVPEYYSTRVYVSVPVGALKKGDAIKIEATTYDGVMARSFVK